jgi:hypothetical protein
VSAEETPDSIAEHLAGSDDPRHPDTPEQMADRARCARATARERHHRARNAQAAREVFGSPYPSVYELYRTADIWEPEPTKAQVRDAANDLVAQGWPTDIVARLLRIEPKVAS